MAVPGTHEVLSGAYLEAIKARRRGLQLRDTFLVIGPGSRVTTSFLFRHPLDGTAMSTLLRHGQGYLNIDACRVGIGSNTGRWPPNVLIVHDSVCENRGEKRVRAITGGQARHADTPASTGECYGQYRGRSTVMHSDADGTEAVTEWVCADGCLVSDLDEQSGVSRSSGHIRHNSAFDGFDGTFARAAGNTIGHADIGGASRFFPQFEDEAGLTGWIRQLLGA